MQAIKLLSRRQLADALGLPATAIYHATRSGKIPFVKCGSKLFYDLEKVRAAIQFEPETQHRIKEVRHDV